ncbi:MAG: NAD(P)/FAD-dependent oxidoreductase [Oscillospiraceae bacterium]|nr:NAD(P)/FAD-dependent oxidoreductase [Oscillospiraceae bacterium]
MPIIVMNVKTPLDVSEAEIVSSALREIGVGRRHVLSASVYKTSLDARKRERTREGIRLVSSILLSLDSENLERDLSKRQNVKYFEELTLNPVISGKKSDGRVVIAGFGPAGMFAALILSEYGYKPIVLERGGSVDERVEKISGYWSGGELDESTNIQFGEGGAGTFSDGKLTTRINDPLCRYVLEKFVEFGAPESILRIAKPHLGTDNLCGIVKNIRERIIENGGEVRFHSELTGITFDGERIVKVSTPSGDIETSTLILAIGHSAHDTFEMLLDSGIRLEPKPFSVGARIEHTQDSVDKSLYGDFAGSPLLPKGEYQLSHRRRDGRACYTFCMCPGGLVVASASKKGTIVTNGMSMYRRDSENANSAVVVSVTPDDFGHNALDGVRFASDIEKKAYLLSGDSRAPSMTVGDFLGKPTSRTVIPSYKPGVAERDLNNLFPQFVTDMMKEGLAKFATQMDCFGNMGAVLTAPETRTSSPVRIPRDENMRAMGTENLIPCGEGPGYAGGIMSAAVDGIRAALEVMKCFAP